MKSPLRAGVFDGKEYIGEALQYNNTYIGTILEVVPNRFVAFGFYFTQRTKEEHNEALRTYFGIIINKWVTIALMFDISLLEVSSYITFK